MSRHLMVDIEALDPKTGGIIVSVGAVVFNIDTGEVVDAKEWEIKVVEQEQKYNRTISARCLLWWMQQSEGCLATLKKKDSERIGVREFVFEFKEFVTKHNMERAWCKGMNFDYDLIEELFKAVGQRWPIKKSKYRDCRVYYDYGKKLDLLPKKIDRKDAHTALGDALFQVKISSEVHQYLTNRNK